MKNTIIDEVTSLPVNQRAELIDILIKSLNPSVDSKIEKIWAKEAERRAMDIKEGEAETVSADLVIKDIRKRFGK